MTHESNGVAPPHTLPVTTDRIPSALTNPWDSFINAIFAPDDIILIRMLREGEYPITQHVTAETLATDPDCFTSFLQKNAERYNIYFGVCPRQQDTNLWDKQCQIAIVRCLWADLDNCCPEDALKRCSDASLPIPSIVVSSGNGTHFYWLLEDPYIVDDCWCHPIHTDRRNKEAVYWYVDGDKTVEGIPPLSPKAEYLRAVLAGIAREVKGDHAIDLSRVLRLPGTANVKGDTPKPCRVFSSTGTFHRLAAFEQSAALVPVAEGLQDYTGTGEADDSLDHLIWACRSADDRSKADFALFCAAIKAGWSQDALWAKVKDIGKFAKRTRENYFLGGWRKALAHLIKKGEFVLPDDYETQIAEIVAFDNSVGTHTTNEPASLTPASPKERKDPKEYSFSPMSSAELAKAHYKQEWLVKRLMVRGQPCIIGGQKKVLKTGLAIDLNLSLGSGSPFLGTFTVGKPVRSCLISGESGQAVIQETTLRVCDAKDIRLEDNLAQWDFRLPQLSRLGELSSLSRGLREKGIEVVVIDPLYLCLLNGSDKQASNLFDMGPLLLEVSAACLDAGATPALAAHGRKNLTSPGEPMELEDLAFSGIQEFARQWLLLSRRQPYRPGTGEHRLWLSAGGSCGHGGLWGVDIEEGIIEEDFGGRFWDVQVLSPEEVKEEDNARRDIKKEEKKEEKNTQEETAFLSTLSDCTEPPTKTALRNSLKWYQNKFNRVYKSLSKKGEVQGVQGNYTVGNGAVRKGIVIMKTTPQREHKV